MFPIRWHVSGAFWFLFIFFSGAYKPTQYYRSRQTSAIYIWIITIFLFCNEKWHKHTQNDIDYIKKSNMKKYIGIKLLLESLGFTCVKSVTRSLFKKDVSEEFGNIFIPLISCTDESVSHWISFYVGVWWEHSKAEEQSDIISIENSWNIKWTSVRNVSSSTVITKDGIYSSNSSWTN